MQSTAHYNLPLFETNDKPKWLVDWNNTMVKLDEAIAEASSGDPDVPPVSEMWGYIQELISKTNSIVSNLYSEYDNTNAYNKNDFCTHNGVLYICTEETFVGDEWSLNNWRVANFSEIMTNCINTLETVVSSIGYIFDANTNYSINDIVWHNGVLYKFRYNYTAGDGWNDAIVDTCNLGYEISNLINSGGSSGSSSLAINPLFKTDVLSSNHRLSMYFRKVGNQFVTSGNLLGIIIPLSNALSALNNKSCVVWGVGNDFMDHLPFARNDNTSNISDSDVKITVTKDVSVTAIAGESDTDVLSIADMLSTELNGVTTYSELYDLFNSKSTKTAFVDYSLQVNGDFSGYQQLYFNFPKIRYNNTPLDLYLNADGSIDTTNTNIELINLLKDMSLVKYDEYDNPTYVSLYNIISDALVNVDTSRNTISLRVNIDSYINPYKAKVFYKNN